MNLIHPATMDLANQVITLDEPTGEAFTLILNRDAAIHLQSLPGACRRSSAVPSKSNHARSNATTGTIWCL
jgi:hypothetical protein